MTAERFPEFPEPADLSEDELRALLERAVPQLPAPAQRLERVKEKAARRRRRRVAGVSATAVVAVTAAGLVLPGLRDGGTTGSPAPPAVSRLAPPASGSSTASGAATDRREPTPTATGPATGPPAATEAVVRHHYPELSGLDLMLPADWGTLTAPKTGAVFTSSQDLGLPTDGCVKPLDGFCTPLARTLEPGGVLIMMTLQHNKLMADKFRTSARPATPSEVVGACRTVGGTAQTTAAITDTADTDVIVQVSVCLARPAKGQQEQLDDALTNAAFS
ncbi:hypothetical protein ABZ901_11770 [Actinacidiphila alni]|uniref:hypothetical protein n=1 Tax=Actinacidiphila alni TaxID=380248 RepID=UPI0033C84BE5